MYISVLKISDYEVSNYSQKIILLKSKYCIGISHTDSNNYLSNGIVESKAIITYFLLNKTKLQKSHSSVIVIE